MVRWTGRSATRAFSSSYRILPDNEAMNPNSAAYHTPRPEFDDFSPVAYVASILADFQLPVKQVRRRLERILTSYPLMMHASHQGRCLWSHACINRPDVVEFLLRFSNARYQSVITLPPANIATDASGNGLLMAPVKLDVFNALAVNDYFRLCDLLAFKNEVDGSNFFHYHSNQPVWSGRQASLDVLFWLSEMWKRLDLHPSSFSPPDVNLMNKMRKTPLQVAIERDNPSAALKLICLFGAFWFNDCLVEPQSPYDAPIRISYMELARRFKSDMCINVLTEAEKKYRINSNVSEQELEADVICSICTDGIENEQKQEWYLPTCGHALHCVCLMRLCASSNNLCCPVCRGQFGLDITNRAPLTVHRIKYITEEEQTNAMASEEALRRQVLAVNAFFDSASHQPATTEFYDGLGITRRLINNGVQVRRVIEAAATDEVEVVDGGEQRENEAELVPWLPRTSRPTVRPVTDTAPSTGNYPTDSSSMGRLEDDDAIIELEGVGDARSLSLPHPSTARRQLPLSNSRSSVISYGVNSSILASIQFQQLLSLIRYRVQRRHSTGQDTVHDMCTSLIAAANTVRTGFNCERNPNADINVGDLLRRLESRIDPPTYQDLFGDVRQANTSTVDGPELDGGVAFARISGEFDLHRQRDARMAEVCINVEDFEKFEAPKLQALFNYLHSTLNGGTTFECLPGDFSRAVGVMIADICDGSLVDCGLPVHVPRLYKDQLIHTITSWVFTTVIERFQCNALMCMKKYIDQQKRTHRMRYAATSSFPDSTQQRAAAAEAELISAMESRWLRLQREHMTSRVDVGDGKDRLTIFLGKTFGVCRRSAESLFNLIVYTCNVLL